MYDDCDDDDDDDDGDDDDDYHANDYAGGLIKCQ